MPVTFQGGYVGGPTAQPIDLTSLQNAVTARNQRLDAPQADRLAKYGLPGLAYFAANGDDNAKRFLDRYYGRDQWQSYIPDVNVQDYTTTPATGTPWDVNARINFERDTFGFAPLAGESAPAGKEAGQRKTGEQVRTEERVQPEVVQTDVTPPIVESQAQTTTPPVTDNTVVTETTTETPRQQWQRPWKQQEIVESTPPPQQATPQPSRQVLGYDRDKSVNANAPVEWQPNANVMQAMEGVLDAMAQMVQRGATPEQAYEGMQRSHDPNLLKLRQAVAGVIGPDGKPLSEQAALDWYQRTYRQGSSGVTDPMNQLDLVARMNQQRQAMAAAQARQQQQTQQPPAPLSEPGYNPNALMQMPLMGNPNTPMPQRPQSGPTQPVPIDPRTGRPISQTSQQPYNPRVGRPAEGAGYQSAMQPMEPATLTQTPYRDQTTGEPVAANPLLDTIDRVTTEARSNAAAHAQSVESQIADEKVQIINEATGRGGETTPTLYLGKRAEGIPLHSAAERSTAQHIVKLATTEPGSRSNKAAAAAIRNVFKQGAPELRRAIRENVQQNGYLVPQGEFARQVYDAVRADPQGTAMFFNDLTTNYLNAGLTQAQTSYQQALAREQNASAAQQEIQTASLERLGPDYADAIQRENLRSLRLANQMAEVQLAFAPQQYSTQIIEALTAAGVSRINAEVAADTIGLARAQLEMQAQIAWLDQQGKLAEVLSGDNLERAKVIVETLKNGEIVEGTPPGVLAAMRNEMYAGLAGVTYDGKDIRYLFGIPWLRFGGQGELTDVPGFPSYADMWRTGQDQGNTGGTNTTTTEPTPEETNLSDSYSLE